MIIKMVIKMEIDIAPVSLWSLQKVNSFETRAQESQEKFHQHFEANVSPVWQMSCQGKAWHDSNLTYDYWNTNIVQNPSLKNYKKNFISISKPMYPLYDRCHARAKHDMTPISLMITETWILFRIQALGITRKTSLSNSELWWLLYVQCHIKMEIDMNLSPLWSLQKQNSFETWAQ